MVNSDRGRTDSMVERAVELFDRGFSCAEAVALVGMERIGRNSDLIPRLATGFGGGVCRTRSMCGALTGGVLVLGAVWGRDRPQDDRAVLLAKVQALVKEFRERFGSDNCFTLTGIDFNEEKAMDVYRDRVHAQCRGYVEQVVERLGALLANQE